MDERSAALIRQAWPRQLVFLLLVAALVFVPAGTLGYWQGWLFIVVIVGCTLATGAYFLRSDPALVERRMKVGPRAEREPTQKIIVALMIATFLLFVVLPAFDYRWDWSAVPVWLVLLAELGIIVSFASFVLVMNENSYAASTVRVEQNQPVISTGPYAVVRHPMYAAAVLTAICMPLALGSYWGLLLMVLFIPLLAWRLLDEERVLRRDLPGYAAYCERVRYRLVPFIW